MKKLDNEIRRIRNLLGYMFFSTSLLKSWGLEDLIHCLSVFYLGISEHCQG
jgi:hypothetical protein